MPQTNQNQHAEWIRQQLLAAGTPTKAEKVKRYFPAGITTTGAMAADVTVVINSFRSNNQDLTPEQVLQVSEAVLKKAEYSEEVLVAFGILNKLVKRNFDDDLLQRFEYWLEHYASNWAHVDDLCIKTIYQFFLSRTHLIETIQPWSHSKVCWCRRASNVAWVKFIHRPIGSKVYRLDPTRVFENCDRLLRDEDEFVQKSIGWLLKVTSQHHQAAVLDYVRENLSRMEKPTLRYALEKVDKETRAAVIAS
ncbi:DNA alkylation repair protein [Pseudomaricurvus alkylphenolicus]|uniref:DNA alkylation repair protein n=1 Tax=Pseudomaricurvus alkylphenolicus TaxID=1306991 RepID=UPI00141E3137|nr:DNA alkylation repair protein [Pseudomaricurvus alkylphenolicus]NIB38663.1 DNA alkylation repair protein [Pseudomaricurvus alkylphenolicus]